MKKIQLFWVCIFGFISTVSNAQWMGQNSLQTTVLLEKIEGTNFINHGTGIVFYNYSNPSELIIVTCKHLLEDKKIISVRVSPNEAFLNTIKNDFKNGYFDGKTAVIGNTVRFMVKIDSTTCYKNPNLDIAAFIFRPLSLIVQQITGDSIIKSSKLLGISKSAMMLRDELNLSDEVYFIGFPLGIGATESVEPIVRSGSIAWLPKQSSHFLLDAFSFGGNSGSPVFKKITQKYENKYMITSGTQFVGMITSHHSLKIENVLNQPDPNTLKFEVNDISLNIGLAQCVYADDILLTINKLLETR